MNSRRLMLTMELLLRGDEELGAAGQLLCIPPYTITHRGLRGRLLHCGISPGLWSARASTVAGTSIANDLAVLRLTRRRNFVASITGNSVRYGGLPPLYACAEHTHMRDDPDRCPHDHGSADDVRIAFDSQSPRRGGDALPLINLEKRDVRLPRRRLCLLDEGPDPGRTFHHPR
jgi:hypothetical protein